MGACKSTERRRGDSERSAPTASNAAASGEFAHSYHSSKHPPWKRPAPDRSSPAGNASGCGATTTYFTVESMLTQRALQRHDAQGTTYTGWTAEAVRTWAATVPPHRHPAAVHVFPPNPSKKAMQAAEAQVHPLAIHISPSAQQ
uniref:Uncharacterized protein n=1 Tax=Neobodo designis TaxID=312471 RepID=A0A7S1M252_NEODS|mmetsp:Transcript_32467/g.100458  ORF Transcript_32467/g.100458 Transcript_32467/m.100458 type:complete len:144 (+) Transcript_32467:76-507(+)